MRCGLSELTYYFAHLRDIAWFDLLPQATQQIRQAPLFLRHLLLRKLLPPAGIAPPACVAPDPTPEDEDLPPVLGHVTERVQEVMDYVNEKHEIGHFTQEQLMVHLIRLQENSNIVTEFAATKVEKAKADKQRITAKNLFGNKGSAIRS